MRKKSRSNYKTIFFDLDRTLWDYRANSELTLLDLVNRYAPELNAHFDTFLRSFYEINDRLWLEYRDGKLLKKELLTKRFVDVFKTMSIDAELFVEQIAQDYINESPQKTKLFPHTIEMLEYLKNKGYRLFLLTNGFLEVQKVKIRESKLEPYFEKMITSEEAGYQKPDRKIFEYAIEIVGAQKSDCIMIGDDLDNDISGAHGAGMDTVYFNPKKVEHDSLPTYEIQNLNELFSIF